MFAGGCGQAPRLSETVVAGERRVVVKAPAPGSSERIRLVHLRDLSFESFPFEPPIWRLRDITSDDRGHVYIADGGHGHIAVTDAEGSFLGKIGRPGPGPYEFRNLCPHSAEWIQGTDRIVALDRQRLLIFESDGAPVLDRPSSASPYSLSSAGRRFVTIERWDPPFLLQSASGDTLGWFGRLYASSDFDYEHEQAALTEARVRQVQFESVRPSNALLPHGGQMVGNALFVQGAGEGTRLRCWDIESGLIRWRVDLRTNDYEPPSFLTYTTSYLGPMYAWDEGDPETLTRSRLRDLDSRDELLFVTVEYLGTGGRTKPDRVEATDPFEIGNELTSRWPRRYFLEVLGMEPDLLAHLPLAGEVMQTEVTVDGLLLVGYNEPLPYVAVYRLEGLPDG